MVEAAAGKFNPHVHVEYDWNLRLEEIDESDDDLDDKVRTNALTLITSGGHVKVKPLTRPDRIYHRYCSKGGITRFY